MNPVEPPCPSDRRPHRERVPQILNKLSEGQTGAICIDDTEVHKARYLSELKKYPQLVVVYQGKLSEGIWMIKVRKGPPTN